MEILISVVIPIYNSRETIIESIYSVLNQSIRPFEIVLINDGSLDDSEKIIIENFQKEINNNYIKLFSFENRGVSVSRNLGITLAKGNWIAFLDSDDLWEESKLSEQINLITIYPECKFFGTGSNILIKRSNDPSILIDYNKNLFKNYFSTSSVLVCRNTLFENGLFNENKKYSEDYELWLSILYNNGFGLVVNKKLMVYNLNTNNNLSSNLLAMFKGEIDNYLVQFQCERINLLYLLLLLVISFSKFIFRVFNYFLKVA